MKAANLNNSSIAVKTELLKRMEGLTVALSTPLRDDGALDVGGLERLVEHVIRGGASCLFPLGWAGEQPLVTNDIRRAVMMETCRLAKGRVPVMVGISEQSIPRVMEQVEVARRAGAAAVLATPPYSYHLPPDLVIAFFKSLAAACELPLVVYQNSEVGLPISDDGIYEISRIPGIIGVKATVSFHDLQRSYYRSNRPHEFEIMSGDEYLFGAALCLGIRHFTMGGPGNICPKWCAETIKAAQRGQWTEVIGMQRRLMMFCDALYSIPALTAYAAVKGALEVLKICSCRITSPHVSASREQIAEIEAILSGFPDVLGK